MASFTPRPRPAAPAPAPSTPAPSTPATSSPAPSSTADRPTAGTPAGSSTRGPVARSRRLAPAAAVLALVALAGCAKGAASEPGAAPAAGKHSAAAPAGSGHAGMQMGTGSNLHPAGHPSVTMGPKDIYNRSAGSVFEIYGLRPVSGKYGFGTGFMIDSKSGMGLTNAHVVAGLTATKVRFADGSVSPLHVMAIDPCSDLAVVHPSQTPASVRQLTFGDQDHLQAGDEVTVLGYPTSLTADFTKTKLAITTGLVQAVGVSAQPGADLPEYPDTVQHSATVNHGNSGGPLIDHHGTVVGVNTLTAEGAAQGQFYSISIGSVKKKIDALMAGKSENDLGWALEPPDIALSSAAADKLAAAKISGLVVTDVDAGSPADHAGIKRDDLITGIQSTATPDMKNVCDILQSVLPGHTVKVTGVHLGTGKAFEVEFNTPGAH